MKIPVYESNQNIDQNKTISPSAYKPAQIQIDSSLSGSAYDTAAAKLGNVVFDIAKMVGDHMVTMKEQDNRKAVLDLEDRYQRELNESILLNPEKENIPDPLDQNVLIERDKGLLNRSGVTANGIYQEYKNKSGELREKYLGLAQNDWQRGQLETVLNRHETDMGSRVLQHETSQREAGLKQSLMGNVSLDIANAGLFVNNPAKAKEKYEFTKKKLVDGLTSINAKKQDIELANKNLAAKYVSNLLDSSTTAVQAKRHLETFKKDLLADDYAKLNNAIEGKLEIERNNYYIASIKDTEAFKKGSINLIYDEIDKDKRLTLDQKIKRKESVLDARNEQVKVTNAVKTAKLDQLKNDVVASVKSGFSLNETLERYAVGDDDTDTAIRSKFIRENYKTYSTKSNPDAYERLEKESHEGSEGVWDRLDIAFQKDELSKDDYEKLKKVVSKGGNPRFTAITSEVDRIARKNGLKKGTPEFNQFKYWVTQESGGNPDLYIQKANELSSKDPNTGYFSFTQDTYFKQKLEAEKQKQQNRLNPTPTPTQAIDKTQSIDQAIEFYKINRKHKSPSPEANAIDHLSTRKLPLTRSNIEKILQKFPDGMPRKLTK